MRSPTKQVYRELQLTILLVSINQPITIPNIKHQPTQQTNIGNWLCDGVRDCIFAADEANCTG